LRRTRFEGIPGLIFLIYMNVELIPTHGAIYRQFNMGGFPSRGEMSRAPELREEENPLWCDNREKMPGIGCS